VDKHDLCCRCFRPFSGKLITPRKKRTAVEGLYTALRRYLRAALIHCACWCSSKQEKKHMLHSEVDDSHSMFGSFFYFSQAHTLVCMLKSLDFYTSRTARSS
jgi:hypothetical protein